MLHVEMKFTSEPGIFDQLRSGLLLFVITFTSVTVLPSIRPSVRQYVRLSSCQSVHPSIRPSGRPSVPPPVTPSSRPFVLWYVRRPLFVINLAMRTLNYCTPCYNSIPLKSYNWDTLKLSQNIPFFAISKFALYWNPI